MDNQTLQQRAASAMALSNMTEADLVRACQRLLGPENVDQRKINRVITPKSDVKNSAFVPVIAEVTGVRAVWLQWGVGEMFSENEADNRMDNTEQLLSLIDNLRDQLQSKRARKVEMS